MWELPQQLPAAMIKSLVARVRVVNETLWLLLFSCLIPISLQAEWITYGIKVPLPYVEESVYDTASGTNYTAYEDQVDATVAGYWVDTDDSSFTSVLYIGDHYATIDVAAV